MGDIDREKEKRANHCDKTRRRESEENKMEKIL